MRKALLTVFLVLFFGQAVFAQQVPDTAFAINIDNPRYFAEGPVIAIDGGHNNFHKINSGFSAFARLMEADGYITDEILEINESNLNSIDILVIANPLHEINVGNWSLPTPSAFDENEIQIISNWVSNGGKLLLIADHMPMAGSASSLAGAFNVEYANGFSMSSLRSWPPDLYTKSQGELLENTFTKGIDSLAGFTGSAIKKVDSAIIIAEFPSDHKLYLPETAWEFEQNCEVKPLDNYCLGLAFKFGKGKIICMSEAAMFTAQLAQGKYPVGFNSAKAKSNIAFILNTIHWLDQND